MKRREDKFWTFWKREREREREQKHTMGRESRRERGMRGQGEAIQKKRGVERGGERRRGEY